MEKAALELHWSCTGAALCNNTDFMKQQVPDDMIILADLSDQVTVCHQVTVGQRVARFGGNSA